MSNQKKNLRLMADRDPYGQLFVNFCKKCGDCCRGLQFNFTNPLDRDDREFYKTRGLEVGLKRVRINDFPCPRLREDNLCSIYSRRPWVCRLALCSKTKKGISGELG